MADGQIRIRIGAVQDRSFDTVFGNVEKRIGKLQETARKALAGTGSGNALSRPMQQAAKDADKAAREIERSWNRQVREAQRVSREQERIWSRGARERVRIEERANREIERVFQESTRAAEREARKQERAAEMAARRQERVRQRFAERTSHRATHFLFPPPQGMLGVGRRVAGDILRGAGVDFSVAGGVQRAVSMQSSAIGLANAERIATGRTRGAAVYDALARNTGDRLSVSSDKVMDLATRFAASAGTYGPQLEQIVPKLVSLAVASGSNNFGDVGDAAAAAFNQLKGRPDQVDQTIAVLRGALGQAAEGAIDPKDYASQLGRISAGAFKFEGDRGENILKLSALAQIGRERGATSAADAARGVKAFVSTLGKGARLKAFDAEGVATYVGDTKGRDGKIVAAENRSTLRDPFEIIKDSFRQTDGDIPRMGKMFMDVLGRQGVESLAAVYQGAGGGEAGISAIDAELQRYMGANLTKDVEKQNIADYEASNAAKAARFQNNLDKIAASMADRVLPALEELAPVMTNLAALGGDVVAFAAKFPAGALAVMGALAIMRAGMEAWGRAALERAIVTRGGGAGAAAGGLTGAGGMPVGRLGRTMRAAGGGVVGALTGAAIGEQFGETQTGAFLGGGAGAGATFGPMGIVAGMSVGSAFDQALKLRKSAGGWDFWNQEENLNRAARAEAKAEGRQFVEGAGGKYGIASGAAYDAMMGKAREQGMLDVQQIAQSINNLGTQTLSVRVVNISDIPREPPSPTVDPSGRQLPAGNR